MIRYGMFAEDSSSPDSRTTDAGLVVIVAFIILRRFSRKELLYLALLMAVVQLIFLVIQILSGELLNIVFYYLFL